MSKYDMLEAKFNPTQENMLTWNEGRAPLKWITLLSGEFKGTREANQDDIDRCSQVWRKHGPGWYICCMSR